MKLKAIAETRKIEGLGLSITKTKSLKSFLSQGYNGKAISPCYVAVMRCDDIPPKDKLPFTLIVVNRLLNGAFPAGIGPLDLYHANSSEDLPDLPPSGYVNMAKEIFIKNPYKVYSRTKKETLAKWSRAIELLPDHYRCCGVGECTCGVMEISF